MAFLLPIGSVTNAIRYPVMCMPDAVCQEIVADQLKLLVEIASHHL
jgi:hypothetical protein